MDASVPVCVCGMSMAMAEAEAEAVVPRGKWQRRWLAVAVEVAELVLALSVG